MATRQRPADRGRARGLSLAQTVGRELREARIGAGVSQDDVGRASGISGAQVGRIERGQAATLSIRTASVVAAVLGLELVVRAYPGRNVLRDAAHIALLRRLLARLGDGWMWAHEVPVSRRDQRAWDALLTHHATGARIVVEAETRITDVQSLLRRIESKALESGATSVLLVASDTRANRAATALAGDILRARFPDPARQALATLGRGGVPERGALVLL